MNTGRIARWMGAALALIAAAGAAPAQAPSPAPTAGRPAYETGTWGGVLAPAGTPREVVARLNAEINRALREPDVAAKLAGAGLEAAGGTPDGFREFIQAEIARWAEVARDARTEPE